MTALECFYKEDSFTGVLGTQGDEILPPMFLSYEEKRKKQMLDQSRTGPWNLSCVNLWVPEQVFDFLRVLFPFL